MFNAVLQTEKSATSAFCRILVLALIIGDIEMHSNQIPEMS